MAEKDCNEALRSEATDMRPPKLSRQTRSPSLLGPSSASGGGVAWLHVRRIAEATGNPKRPGRGEGRGTTLERRRASSCSVTSGDGLRARLRATFGCANGMRRADWGDLRFRITDGAPRAGQRVPRIVTFMCGAIWHWFSLTDLIELVTCLRTMKTVVVVSTRCLSMRSKAMLAKTTTRSTRRAARAKCVLAFARDSVRHKIAILAASLPLRSAGVYSNPSHS